jgi:sugar phosphate isomerase/epimerase
MITRRNFTRTALSAAPLLLSSETALRGQGTSKRVAPFASRFGGVQIAVQTYSYRTLRDASQPWSVEGVERQMDRVVDSIVENQINAAEFWIAFIEPPGGPGRTPLNVQARENLRKWRTSRPLDLFERCRKKFNDAGIDIYSAMFNLSDDLSDDELDAAFEMTKALGTNILSTNCTRRSIKRAAPFADKHKIYLSAHSEDAPFDPDVNGMVFGDNLVESLKYSPYMRVTLDTGHFTAYNGDVLKFLREHKDRIANLHLKDRLHNHPQPHTDDDTTEWGKGDAPLKEALQFLKREKLKCAATIEYEYPGKGSPVEEVRKCLDYARYALA